MASEDEFSNYSDEELTQVQYQPRISDASPRPRSASKKGKSPRPPRPGSSATGNPYASSGKPPGSARKSSNNLNKSSAGSRTGTKKDLLGSKTPQQYYTETLRRTGVGFSDPSKIDSFSGLSKTQTQNMSFSSTSHYLRQKVGVEKKNTRARPASAGRPAGGGPAYKSQEEYYDDIIELKKQIQSLSQDNSVMKSRVRRLEEDNAKKEKEIGQLLDPSKSEEMRRTLADRKPDAGTVIHSMKQKILKLEQQLKEKESAYNKLQSDMKTTKVEELKLQTEMFYNEVLRLQKLKSVDAPTFRNTGHSSRESKESPAKLKALQETILKTNERNYKLQAENKSLKEDLDKLMQAEEKRHGDAARHGDKNKKELMSTISKLEKRLERAEETTSLMSDIDARSSNIEGKIKLEGTAAQRIDQLDRRETELLEELAKSRKTCKKLKEDRAHYRQKVDEKDKEIRDLRAELEEVHAELDTFYEKDKSRVSPRRPSPVRSERSSMTRASRGDKTPPPQRKQRASRYDPDEVEQFTRKHAAKTIQSRWRNHKHEKDELEEAETAEMIQSYLRAHSSRKKNLQRKHYDEDDPSIRRSTYASRRSVSQADVVSSTAGSESEDFADVYAKQLSNTGRSTLSSTLRSNRGLSDDEDEGPLRKRDSGRFTSVSASYGRSSPRASPKTRPKSPYARNKPIIDEDDDESDDDDDDEDDLIVTSSRSKGKIF